MSSCSSLPLDPHIRINYLDGSPRLVPGIAQQIEEARLQGNVLVSVISISKIALLVRLKRLLLPITVAKWTNQALLLSGVSLLPFSQRIAIEAVDLPEPMHNDPCDRILVATARIERLTLVTRDGAILDFAKATNLAVMKA
jgi:PIN domain nuclease of toxin-antitoxin system